MTMGSNGFRLFSFPWVETNGPSPIEGSFVLPQNDPERARPDWSGTEWNLVWPGFDVRFSQPGLETGPVRPHSAPFRLGLIPHLTSSGSIPGRATERNSSSTRERWLANGRSISDRDVRLAGARFRTAASASHATCGGLYFIFSIFLLRVNTKRVAPVRAMLLYESRNLMR